MIQPSTNEITIDITIPQEGAVREFLVSSVMWIDAWSPVNVYCASSSPSSSTYLEACQPVWLTNLVNTKLADSWCCGMKNSAQTISSTVTTCHHTDRSFRNLTSLTPKVFSMPCTNRMTA